MERQIQDTFTRFTGNNEGEKLIDFNKNQGKFDYKVNSNIQNQDSSRLGVKSNIPQKERPKPPSNNKKVPRSDFETKLFNSRSAAKVLQQNRQMFKASKTVWDTNITNIRNPLCLLNSMIKSNTDRSQVREIYTLPYCRMSIIHMGHYDAKGSEQINHSKRYQVK